MGRGKKRRKKHKVLTLYKFREKYCSNCILCPSNNKAEFCYSCIYKEDQTAFISKCWPKLKKLEDWLDPSYEETRLFKRIFCDTNSCGVSTGKNKSCPHRLNCLSFFRRQIEEHNTHALDSCGYDNGLYDRNYPFSDVTNKKNKRSKNQKCESPPEVLFTINDDPEWEDFIRRTLADNNK